MKKAENASEVTVLSIQEVHGVFLLFFYGEFSIEIIILGKDNDKPRRRIDVIP